MKGLSADPKAPALRQTFRDSRTLFLANDQESNERVQEHIDDAKKLLSNKEADDMDFIANSKKKTFKTKLKIKRDEYDGDFDKTIENIEKSITKLLLTKLPTGKTDVKRAIKKLKLLLRVLEI